MADGGRYGPRAYARAFLRLVIAPVYVPFALWRRRRLSLRLARDERHWREARASGICATCGRPMAPVPPGRLAPGLPAAVREYRLWEVSVECGGCRAARLALELAPGDGGGGGARDGA